MMQRLSQAFQSLTPEQIDSINTTTEKHIIGKRLTLGTAAVCCFVFLWEVFDGGSRSERVAMQVLEAWLLFLAAYLGLNVAQFGIKRGTDKDTKVAVAEAKAKSAPPTVLAQGDSSVQVIPAPATAERPALVAKPRTEPDLYLDDERGD